MYRCDWDQDRGLLHSLFGCGDDRPSSREMLLGDVAVAGLA